MPPLSPTVLLYSEKNETQSKSSLWTQISTLQIESPDFRLSDQGLYLSVLFTAVMTSCWRKKGGGRKETNARQKQEGKKSGRMPAMSWEHMWSAAGESQGLCSLPHPGGPRTIKHGGLQTSLSWHPGTTTKELGDLTKVTVLLYATIA